jgi:hypothetical protein
MQMFTKVEEAVKISLPEFEKLTPMPVPVYFIMLVNSRTRSLFVRHVENLLPRSCVPKLHNTVFK